MQHLASPLQLPQSLSLGTFPTTSRSKLRCGFGWRLWGISVARPCQWVAAKSASTLQRWPLVGCRWGCTGLLHQLCDAANHTMRLHPQGKTCAAPLHSPHLSKEGDISRKRLDLFTSYFPVLSRGYQGVFLSVWTKFRKINFFLKNCLDHHLKSVFTLYLYDMWAKMLKLHIVHLSR